MKLFILALASATLLVNSPASAQEAAQEAVKEAVTQEQAQAESPADPTYDERIALAKKMHELRPVREQVEQAINQYAQTRPQGERESFKSTMRNVFNMRALEKISIDAYAETFTAPELSAMVEYYSKPEAISAGEKFDNYAGIVYPEIVRMLDRAAIRVRTGE